MRARFALAAGLIHVACGGSRSTIAPTALRSPVPPSSVAVSSPLAPDLSPVANPAGLGLTVHLAHPRDTLRQVTSLFGSLGSLFGGGAKLDPGSLVATAIGAPIGAVVDLDQPIDCAVSDVTSSETSPQIAGSAALIDPGAARETLEKYFEWTPAEGGVVRLQPRGEATSGGAIRPCILAPSFGASPGATRLVCGSGKDALRSLSPYLTRTMTRLSSRDDLRVEMFVRALRPPKSGDAAALPGAGPAAVDAAAADPTDALFEQLTGKLTTDVGSLVLEASTDASTVDVRLTTRFVDTGSPLTRALVGAGAPALSVPAAFDRLPSGALSAWYGRGATPADLAPLRKTVFDGFRAMLEDEGYTSSVSGTLVAPLERLLLTGGPWVVATGLDLDAARAALDSYVSAGKSTEVARAAARRPMQGWAVAAVEEPPQAWIDGVREIVKGDSLKPTGKPTRPDDPQKESTRLALAPLVAALKLPPGTLHVEAHVTQNAAWTAAQTKAKVEIKDPLIPRTLHVFVVPDGARTWFAAAEDPLVAAREVRASLSGADDSGTLKVRRDLDGLRGMPASTAGFASVASLATWLVGDASNVGLRRARESLAGLAGLTEGGGTPVPFALTATPATGGAVAGGDVLLRILFPIRVGMEVAASPHSIF
jgi:hypothetical protein